MIGVDKIDPNGNMTFGSDLGPFAMVLPDPLGAGSRAADEWSKGANAALLGNYGDASKHFMTGAAEIALEAGTFVPLAGQALKGSKILRRLGKLKKLNRLKLLKNDIVLSFILAAGNQPPSATAYGRYAFDANSVTDMLRDGRICFVAGTKVLTEQGYKNIEDIKVGDSVLSYDEKTAKNAYKEVTHLFLTKPERLVHLSYRHAKEKNSQDDDEDHRRGEADSILNSQSLIPNSEAQLLTGTTEHPFYSVNRQKWVVMEQLQIGEKLLLANGQQAIVENLTFEDAPGGQEFTTYNFEVADFHTYYVASAQAQGLEDAVLVHNKRLRYRCGNKKKGKGKILRKRKPKAKKKAPEPKGVLSAESGLSPADFNTFSLASRQDTLELWKESLRSAASSNRSLEGNMYQKFLKQLDSGVSIDDINKELLEGAFATVSSAYTRRLRKMHKKGLMLDVGDGPIHHWNYNKILYPEDLVDPRNLIMTKDLDHHMMIHRATTSGHITKDPILEMHVRKLNNSFAFPLKAVED